MNVWGLVHSNLLTTPVIVFSCVMSNTANEWCAESDDPPITRPAITKPPNRRMFICTCRDPERTALLIDVDGGLAVLIHEVAVVLFADVFGNGPDPMTPQRPVGRVRRGQRVGIHDGRFDRHRVRIGELEA